MSHRRALRDGLGIAGLAFAGYLFLIVAPVAGTVGFDAFAYWSVNLDHPYRLVAGELGAFPYTPIAARFFAPFALLPWPAFWWLWTALLLGTAIWLGWRQALLVLAFPPVALELYHGNVHLLIAAAVALGLRYPWAWAFVLLTKVTPGVGLIWFAVRREWRSLGMAIGATGVLVALSVVLDGRLWREWIVDGLLPVASGPVQQFYIAIPLALRLAAAAVVVAWGARTDRTWTLPVAAALALPVLWLSGLSVLAAIPAVERLRPGAGHVDRVVSGVRDQPSAPARSSST